MFLLNILKRTKPEFYPHVLQVDGGGILHHRQFGSASHLGLMTGLPSIGISKILKIKTELNRLCLYIVNNIDIINSETAMFLIETGARSEWRTNLLRYYRYSFTMLDVYKPIFNVDKACYKLAKLMTQINHSKTKELYELLARISDYNAVLYNYDFIPDDYDVTEED